MSAGSGANAFLVRDLLRHQNLAMTGLKIPGVDPFAYLTKLIALATAGGKSPLTASRLSTTPCGGPPSDEYRVRADACLHWAREAPSDEVRLACLALANAWLKAAVREDSRVSYHLPPAPTL